MSEARAAREGSGARGPGRRFLGAAITSLLLAVVLALFAPGLLEEFRKWWAGRQPGVAKPIEVIDVGEFTVEVYGDPLEFAARLRGQVARVDFDDIDTLGPDPVPFDSRRYASSRGVLIRGTDGQYADESFGSPQDYHASSGHNMYAPGPRPGERSILPRGGHKTHVAFLSRGRPARVSGFGAMFIDVDEPTIGPSALEIFTRTGRQLVRREGFAGESGEAVFRGLVVLDREGLLAPLIERVTIVSGDEWPSFQSGEGVALDDFIFEEPTAD